MPKAKLSKTLIDATPFTDSGQLLIWDTELRGYGLCVSRTAKTFIVQRDVEGQSLRVTIGRYGIFTPEQARKEAQQLLFTMSNGIDPNAEKKARKREQMSLRELLASFLKARKSLGARTRADYTANLTRHLPDWLDQPVAKITSDKFFERYFEIGEKSGETSANNVRRILGSILSYGIAAHKLLPTNPVRIIADAKCAFPNRRRQSYIKPHQFPALWDAIQAEESDTCRDYFLMLWFTGMRRSEPCKLEWQNVDLTAKTLTIPDTKNGEALVLPLSDFLHKLLERRKKQYGNYKYVFPGTGESEHYEDPKKALARITNRCGIKFSPHDLRRTYITVAESLDISAYALKRLLNHKISNDITGGYIIVDVERLRSPVERISQTILEAVNHGQA